MAKRKYPKRRSYRSRIRNFARKKSKPSLIDLIGFGAPQAMSMLGMPGMGYDVTHYIQEGNLQGAIQQGLANEVLLFTGIDINSPNKWHPEAPLMNYGLMLLMPKLVRKITKRKDINIPMLGRVKVI